MKSSTAFRNIASAISSSKLLAKGRRLWEQNQRDWNLPLSKKDKLWCGMYIILEDFARGQFPPEFKDQSEAYQREIDLDISLPGVNFADAQRLGVSKPFWGANTANKYLSDFGRLYALLEKYHVTPGAGLLELGCGCGWMAEFFATAGYSVTATTISPRNVEIAKRRVAAHHLKLLASGLEYYAIPMEEIGDEDRFQRRYEATYVYEALHHAFDWRRALLGAAKTLKTDGKLLIAGEPNRLHTFISYRIARLSHTHEIGFRKSEIVAELRKIGFQRIDIIAPPFDNWVSKFWIVATGLQSGTASSAR